MKKTSFLLVLFMISFGAYSQSNNVQGIFDSILNEADLLYKYEKSVWNSTDLLLTNDKLKEEYGGYVVNHINDTILVTYVSKNHKTSIARYKYISNNLTKPYTVSIESSLLNATEQELFDMKVKILNQLRDEKYGLGFPQGFKPNLVLLKSENEFKLYILMGTTQSGVIPFGNDYLFKADNSGNIIDWKKFHSRIIPIQSKGPNGEIVLTSVHSHLKATPYITATDICTFRLYGELCGMEEFIVSCTATESYYKYNLKTNKIEITKL